MNFKNLKTIAFFKSPNQVFLSKMNGLRIVNFLENHEFSRNYIGWPSVKLRFTVLIQFDGHETNQFGQNPRYPIMYFFRFIQKISFFANFLILFLSKKF